MKKIFLAAMACATLAACGTIKLDRAISGGALGAGAGAFAGPGGALAGGLVGAGVGALTPPGWVNLGQPLWRRSGTVNVGTTQPRYERPTLTVDGFGYGRAAFANGCTVQYGPQGARTGYFGACDNNQIGAADQEMYNYRLGANTVAPNVVQPVAVTPAVDINRMRANCEAAADQRWGLLRGASRATAVRGDDRSGYQIDVAAGFQQARCTMALNGDVVRFD